MTRSGLRALVTMTRLNSLVEVSATVPSGWFVTPALTNSRSNIWSARRSCSAAICPGSVTSRVSISMLPGAGIGEVVQRGAARAAHGGHDMPAVLRPLCGQCQAKTARCADQEHPAA